MAISTPNSEYSILSRIIAPERPDMATEAARAILALSFSEDDRKRMDELIAKAKEGSLNADEQAEIERYERVGHLLSLLHSKARISLQSSASVA